MPVTKVRKLRPEERDPELNVRLWREWEEWKASKKTAAETARRALAAFRKQVETEAA
jgi:hypothetical protein